VTFAREGYPFIAGAALVAVFTIALAALFRSYPLWIVAALLALVALWVAYFFRDPERTGPRGNHLVIAPADGLVLPAIQTNEPLFLKGQAIRISIFMNVFDVHVNRWPVNGTVRLVQYHPGTFVNASLDKASLNNERMSIGIESDGRRILMVQIAGLVARRIVNDSAVGDSTRQGERCGMIRFGSRVDVFLPPGSVVRARSGERVRAGVSVIAELSP
jgi:phosphatidylserine decarboxylase